MHCYQYSIQAIFNSSLNREKQFDKSVHKDLCHHVNHRYLSVAYFCFTLMGFGDLLSFLPRFRDFEIFLTRFRDFSFSLPRFRDLTPLYLPPAMYLRMDESISRGKKACKRSKLGQLNRNTSQINLSTYTRFIYKADHRSYDRAKTHMIGQNLFARSSWSSRIFTKP